MPDTKLIDGKVELRPHSDGSFDELVLYDAPGGKCIVHAEMMDRNRLWIGFYPPGETERRVVMWIGAKGKLTISAEED
jgi:hypothetical protein